MVVSIQSLLRLVFCGVFLVFSSYQLIQRRRGNDFLCVVNLVNFMEKVNFFCFDIFIGKFVPKNELGLYRTEFGYNSFLCSKSD